VTDDFKKGGIANQWEEPVHIRGCHL